MCNSKVCKEKEKQVKNVGWSTENNIHSLQKLHEMVGYFWTKNGGSRYRNVFFWHSDVRCL